ncbi:MAG TPA: DUF5132 domain-containing protein [Blastocatellia bacterium]|nr:DUF5132 domain-containing protein [Blastocatellia bacterium]
MLQTTLAFIGGIVIAPFLKPILREVIKYGIIVADTAVKAAAEARESIEDLAAEAAAEAHPKPSHPAKIN